MQKKQQFVPKIPISDHKLPNTARNYPILLTNTHFLQKNNTCLPKKPNSYQRRPIVLKAVQFLPLIFTAKLLNLVKKYSNSNQFRRIVEKYPNCKQYNKILSNIYLK